MTRYLGFVLASVLLLFVPALIVAEIVVEEQVSLGEGDPGEILRGTAIIQSVGDAEDAVSAIASDSALRIDPESFTIGPSERRTLSISLTLPESEEREIVRLITFLPENGDPVITVVRARIRSAEAGEPAQSSARELAQSSAREPAQSSAAAAPIATIDLYMDATCSKCRALADQDVRALIGSLSITVAEHDIMVPKSTDELIARLTAAGVELAELPVAIITPSRNADEPDVASPLIFQGFDQIVSGIETALQTPGGIERMPLQDAAEISDILTLGAVIGAGLLDGINPCAFSTMLFLISMLAVAGRTRREILVIGVVYSLTIFGGYVAAGFGLFAGVRTLMVFPTLVAVMRWTLFALLLVLSALSFRDAALAGQGRTSEMTLQLPDTFKRRVHAVVRSGTRSASLVGGTVALGIGVTIFEFSCTGQVYVPVIMHLARTGSGTAVGLLLLYNVAFIIPLLIVFGLAYTGISMKRVGSIFGERLVLVKVGLAIVFAGFAVLTIAV